jgi:hypothetical protein
MRQDDWDELRMRQINWDCVRSTGTGTRTVRQDTGTAVMVLSRALLNIMYIIGTLLTSGQMPRYSTLSRDSEHVV